MLQVEVAPVLEGVFMVLVIGERDFYVVIWLVKRGDDDGSVGTSIEVLRHS